MKVKAFEEWSDGLDVRRPKNLDNPDSLIRLHNAYITSGGAVKIREGAKPYTSNAESPWKGTNVGGLAGHNGKLITASQASWKLVKSGGIDNPDLWCYRVEGYGKVANINFCGGFNTGLVLNVTYETGRSRMYWSSDSEPGNCVHPSGSPETEHTVIFQQRVYMISDDGKSVKYSKLSDPNTWTGTDTGFIATGEVSIGSNTATGLALINNRLIVFMEDAIQIWALDPDPKRVELEEQVSGIGSRWGHTAVTVNKDVFFLSDLGIRSLTSQNAFQNIKGSDIGSAIDPLVQAHIRNGIGYVDAEFYPGMGQYWLTIRDAPGGSVDEIFVLSKSSADKLNAWSTYHIGGTDWSMNQLSHLGARMYVLNQVDQRIYQFDEDTDGDGGSQVAFDVEIETPFYGFGLEGQYKMMMGMEAIFEGKATIDHCVNPNNMDDRTHSFDVIGDTRTKPSLPIGILAPTISTRIKAKSKYPDEQGQKIPGFKTLNSLIYRYQETRGGI